MKNTRGHNLLLYSDLINVIKIIRHKGDINSKEEIGLLYRDKVKIQFLMEDYNFDEKINAFMYKT